MAFTLTETPSLLPEELRARLDAALGSAEINFLSEAGSREQLLDSLQTVVIEGDISMLNMAADATEGVLQDTQRLLVVDLVNGSQPLTQLMSKAVDLLKAEVSATCQRDLLICLQPTAELELETWDDCIQAVEPLALEDTKMICGEIGIAPANRVLLMVACK